MDKTMLYAVKRWFPLGVGNRAGRDVSLDSYFALRLLAGVAVLDNNSELYDDMRQSLEARGLFKQP
jgi:hypothetical protein